MRAGRWLMALAGVSLLGSVALPRWLPEAARPDLFIILVLFPALWIEPRLALPFCWLTGLARDLLSAGPLGEYALIYLLAGLALLPVRRFAGPRQPLANVGLGFLAAFATGWASVGMNWLWAGLSPAPGAARTLALSSLVTAAVTPFCLALLDRLKPRRRHRIAAATYQAVEEL